MLAELSEDIVMKTLRMMKIPKKNEGNSTRR